MSLVLRPSRSSSTNTPPTQQLTDALKGFETVLSDSERQKLHSQTSLPDADAVLIFTAELDVLNSKRNKRSISRPLFSFLECTRDFSTVVSTFVSSNPTIAALVWGSVQFAMIIFANLASYCGTAASDIFYELGSLCPRLAEYQGLYPASETLKTALCNFHASVIRFCKHIVEVLQRPLAQTVLDSLWRSFEQEFKPDRENIRILSKIVKDETAFAKMQADLRDQQLQEIERSRASRNRHRVSSFIQRTDNGIRNTNNQLLQRDRQQAWERRKALLSELSTHDHLTPLKQGRQKRYAGTTEWVFQTEEYVKWVGGRGPSLLWCTGKIGSGKTVLSASVIDHILTSKNNPNVLLAFYFLRFDDQESLLAETAIRSILKQLLNLEEFEGEEQLERALHSSAGTSTDELLQILILRIMGLEQCYIVIDGIDEFQKQERTSLFKMLFNIVTQTPNTRLFLSGRQSLTLELRAAFPSFQCISMDFFSEHSDTKPSDIEPSDIEPSDIERYVNGIIDEKINNEELHVGNPDLIVDIKNALRDGADGMFLWVTFEIEEICLQHCDEDIRSVISCLPKDLTEVFNRVLRRIVARRNPETVQQAFRWIGGMKIPPRLDELGEIIFAKIGQQYSMKERRCNDIQQIASWCENLVTVDEESKLVQFGHHSIREFLLQKSSSPDFQNFHFDLGDATHYIGEICVTYLHFNDFKTTLARRQQPIPAIKPMAIAGLALGGVFAKVLNKKAREDTTSADVNNVISGFVGSEPEETDSEELKISHPFLAYARKYWIFHTSGFQEGKSKTWTLWEKMILNGHKLAETPWGDHLFAAADDFQWVISQHHLGLFRLVVKKRLLSEAEGNMILQLPSEECTDLLNIILHEKCILYPWIEQLLLEAIKSGNTHYFGNFLAAGVFRFSDVISEKEALHAAIKSKQTRIIEMLLATKHDLVIFTEYRGSTALRTAVNSGDADVVRMLLAAGVDVNALSNRNLTALQDAIRNRRIDIVRILLAAGAEVNDSSDGTFTVLQEAVQLGNAEIIESLLLAGADVNTLGRGTTALQEAARYRRANIVETLLSAGAEVDALSTTGSTALQEAIRSGYPDNVRILLAAGADVNTVPSDKGFTALQAAARYGHIEIVEKLLSVGAHVNAASSEGGLTALQAAAQFGHTEVLNMLLAAGAHVDAISSQGGFTALQTAARSGHAEIVDRLLAAGSDVNAAPSNAGGLTALQAAAQSGNGNIVERLLAAGADVNAAPAETSGLTALQAAISCRNTKIVDMLLGAGADVNAAPSTGGLTALQAAAQFGHETIVEKLLAAGADINAAPAGFSGLTALQAAAEEGFSTILDRLLEAGANAEATLERYLSPAARAALERAVRRRNGDDSDSIEALDNLEL